ncbi:MAG: translation initiation factor IF-3 [Candidatus Liptonbacteria bacterium]|nr:translation initiation factor IF-3 [Candidatus Liptonbacteria bacterium]
MRYQAPRLQDVTRINERIIAAELRVVGANGENLGVLSRAAALALAKPEEGLDLIEIAPNAKPPVARLMSFDKYRYQKEKQERKERQAQRGSNLKQIQISVREAAHDLLRKATQASEFLEGGSQVEIQLRLRGREKGNQVWARQKLDEFLKMFTIEHKLIHPPQPGGRGLVVLIVKK